jgi:hypothetical protein
VVVRVLWVIRDGLVYVLDMVLLRWRCVVCGLTFRHYPEGVAPYKRYVVLTLIRYGWRYLKEPTASYRQVVHSEGQMHGQPILHAGEPAEADWSEARKRRDEGRALSHATLWRFLGFLGFLGSRRRGWTDPFREQGRVEAGEVDFSPWMIAPHKYRSEARRATLVLAARQLAALVGRAAGRFPTDFGTFASGP